MSANISPRVQEKSGNNSKAPSVAGQSKTATRQSTAVSRNESSQGGDNNTSSTEGDKKQQPSDRNEGEKENYENKVRIIVSSIDNLSISPCGSEKIG